MQRWDALEPEFAKLGIRFVAISPDNPDEAARFVRTHDLRVRILSDGDLAATDLYGLRREKTFAPAKGRKLVRPMAVPTTILVDGDGIVRWIDQTDDYRIRSDASRVLEAVRKALA